MIDDLQQACSPPGAWSHRRRRPSGPGTLRATFAAADQHGLGAWLSEALSASECLSEDSIPALVQAALRILAFALPRSDRARSVEVVVTWEAESMSIRIGPDAGAGVATSSVVLLHALSPPSARDLRRELGLDQVAVGSGG